MGYLVLTRREDESLYLTIDPAADRQELLRQLEHEGIEVWMTEIKSLREAKIGIRAPDGINIARAELVGNERYSR